MVSPTIGLAIDAGGFTADAGVALDSDLVNVFIDASHACELVMMYLCDEFQRISVCIYLTRTTDCRRVHYVGPSVTCVKVSERRPEWIRSP